MNRREFFHKLSALSGATLLASIINACKPFKGTPPAAELQPTAAGSPTRLSQPTAAAAHTPPSQPPADLAPTPPPEPTAEDPTMTPSQQIDATQPATAAALVKVALVKSADRSQGVRRAIELLGLDRLDGKRVLLKPNFNSADPPPASTHLSVLRTLVQSLNEMGAGPITVGERSGMGDTRQVLEQTGVFDLSAELGFEVMVFDELAEADWVIERPAGSHWSNGFAVPKILLETDCVVQTCNLKTHQYGGHFTMSLKNSVGFAAKTVASGGYNYMSELHDSPDQRRMIAEINTVYTPTLIVIDGVEAFVDGGPAEGKRVAPEVTLVGTDRIAMDAVGVAILRLFGTTPEVSQGRIFDQEQIARAVELGLGVDSPAKIELVTGDAESESFASALRELLD